MNDNCDSIYLVDKPFLWTSFDVVKKLRYTLQVKKVGHAGTLDPLATGLLIVCTGKKTKTIKELLPLRKVYSGQIFLGAKTLSYDLEKYPSHFHDIKFLKLKDIEKAMEGFLGKTQQRPPIFSATKINGKPAYILARQGKEVNLKLKTIEVYKFELIQWIPPLLFFRLECSSGTYIRTIANDLGDKLGCGGYLNSLRREKIGDYKIDNAQKINTLVKNIKNQIVL